MIKGDNYSHQFIVTPQIYASFIKLFNDKNPLHTNEVFANSKGFTSVVMHGNILNGFLSYFIGELLPIKNIIIQTQEIKYFHPIYLNDILNFNAEIIDVFESIHSIEFKFYFMNANFKKVAKGKILIGII